jgi:heptosyltransferase-2
MKIEKILVIRFRRVGDAVLSSTLCSSLKKTFPNAEIHYVLNEAIAPLFENHPDIDRLITFSEIDRKSFFKYIGKIFQLVQKEKYDIIIDTRATLNTLWFSVFSLSTEFRIGRKKRYNALIHNCRINTEKITGDEIQKALSLIRPLEKISEIQYIKDYKLYVTDAERESFKQYMLEQGIDFNKKIILCTPVTRVLSKMWNPSYMKEVLLQIIEKSDIQIIFNFAGNEEQMAIDFHQAMHNNPHIFTNINAKSLRELLALMSHCDFFFGNEGGPRHISQAFNMPSFALFSPSICKETWLINKCDRFQGLAPQDIKSKEELDLLTFEEQYNVMTTNEVWKRLNPMLDKFLQV